MTSADYTSTNNQCLFGQLKFWHIEKTVTKVDPILHVDVLDKDVFSKDDKLGKSKVNL